jgi:hypothetical protein
LCRTHPPRYYADVSSLQAASALPLSVAFGNALAVAEGSRRSPGAWLAADVQAWFASPEQGLVAGIEPLRGPDAVTDALGRLAPSALSVAGVVSADDVCWAEITRRGDREPAETCVVGLTFDADGAVSRLVWLRAPLVPMGTGEEEADAPDGRPILKRYLAELMRSNFAEAAAQFSTDAIYSHPPYAGGTERVLYQGRGALAHGFVTDRGPSPARQVITHHSQRAGRVFVEGVVEGIPNGGTFFSTGHITPRGEIARYVAFYSARRIPAEYLNQESN